MKNELGELHHSARMSHGDGRMEYRWSLQEHLALLRFVAKWLSICLPLGFAVGTSVAFFLWSLDQVTEIQWQFSWLLYCLPVAGAVSGVMYRCWGAACDRGHNLILEQIHEPGGGVPARMAPLVLLGTLMTHLFGGSAGREGTAVQMGGSLASSLGRRLRLASKDQSILLMCGISAGFGAVFGTPLTGAIFAIEVIAIGTMNYRAIVPCLMASMIGDQVTLAWGIQHSHYDIPTGEFTSASITGLLADGWLFGKVLLAGVCFGGISVLFVQLSHGSSSVLKRLVPVDWLRPAIGGLIVIALVWLTGRRDYLGLGVFQPKNHEQLVTIQTCFVAGGATLLSWWWKTVLTAVTVGSGFKGGEVTPLFFIGAAAGHAIATLVNAPVGLFAALGFVGVFAGATNTPLACTIMAVELFSKRNPHLLASPFIAYAGVVCFLAYLVSGRSSLYHSQRIGMSKIPEVAAESLDRRSGG